MIIVDVNIPIHAINRESRYHLFVRSWWNEQLSGTRPVGLAWVVCFGFVRILTNPRIISPPLSVDDAHLAALAIQHGGVLYTTDTDFVRFPELRWCNLLTEK